MVPQTFRIIVVIVILLLSVAAAEFVQLTEALEVLLDTAARVCIAYCTL